MNYFCHLAVNLVPHQKHCLLLNYVAVPDSLTFIFLAVFSQGLQKCTEGRTQDCSDGLRGAGLPAGFARSILEAFPERHIDSSVQINRVTEVKSFINKSIQG